MDLLDFTGEDMYFDRRLPGEVEDLLALAAEHYGSDASAGDSAELALLRAHFLAPDHLTVLVALYRFFYYRHRYPEALLVAERAIVAAGRELGLGEDWRCMSTSDLAEAAARSMSLTRFLLLALKGAGFLLMRMDDPVGASERFEVVTAFDDSDRLGAGDLLGWARTAARRAEIDASGGNVSFIRP